MQITQILLFTIFDGQFFNAFSRFLYFTQFNIRQFEKLKRSVVRIILMIDHPHDSRIDKHLRAQRAGLVGAVESCALDADAVNCRLDDGILLRVHGAAEFVVSAAGILGARASVIRAVGQALGNSVIAGGENSFVLDQNRTGVPSQTGGPAGYYLRNLHEVIIKLWSMHGITFLNTDLILNILNHLRLGNG
jgi:hypothetical protein